MKILPCIAAVNFLVAYFHAMYMNLDRTLVKGKLEQD